MFTGRYQAIPGSGEMITPTTGESMTAAFKSDFLLPFVLLPGMEKDKREALYNRVSALREVSERGNQGIGQRLATWVSSLAGSILNPISILTGEAAGIIARPLIARGAGLIGKYSASESVAFATRPLSETLGKNLPEFVGKESIGSLTRKGISGYAMATGFSLPMELAATYNPEGDAFNYFGGIKAAAADGGFGLALMSAPFLAGTIWGKLFKRSVPHSEMPLPGEPLKGFSEAHIDKAVQDKWMTPEEGQWFKDYAFKRDSNENLSKRATEILIKDGHPVDASTNQFMLKILHPEDFDNFQTALSDSIASNLPENIRNLYKEFIGHGRMDEIRKNPGIIDGIRGVSEFVNKRLKKAPEEIKIFKSKLNRLLKKELTHEGEESLFSQKNILRMMKKLGFEKSHVESLPFTIPENLKSYSNIIAKINKIKRKIEIEKRKTGIENKQSLKRLADLESKLPKVFTLKEEITFLRDKLLSMIENDQFKTSHEYRRLLELSNVRSDARHLMHELNLRHEYELHSAYATMLDTITKVMRSEFGKFAKPENINTYMRERIQSANPQFKNLEIDAVKSEVKEVKVKLDKAYEKIKTPEGQGEAIKVLDEEMRESTLSEIRREFDEIRTQMNEFKDSENVFSALVKCVLGARNV